MARERRKSAKQPARARRKPARSPSKKAPKRSPAPSSKTHKGADKRRGGSSTKKRDAFGRFAPKLKGKLKSAPKRDAHGRFVPKKKRLRGGWDLDEYMEKVVEDLEAAGFSVEDAYPEVVAAHNIGTKETVDWHHYRVLFTDGEPIEPERAREAFQPFYDHGKAHYAGNTILRMLIGIVNDKQTDERWATVAATQKFRSTRVSRGPMRGNIQGGAFEEGSIENGVLDWLGKSVYKEFFGVLLEVVAPKSDRG